MKSIARYAGVLLVAGACLAADRAAYRLETQYPVPGNGGFDYIVLDGSSNRLYLSHGNEVDVLDENSGKLLGKVTDTPGVHGIAIVPDLHRGFTTNGQEGTISVFDTNTFKTVKKIKVDKDPDFTFYDSQSKRVLVCHGDAAAITAIDPNTEAVIGKVALGGGAEAAVVDKKGRGFVNLEEEAMVVGFDPQHLKVNGKWPIEGCKTPTGLAMDTDHSRLFIGCRSKVLAVMNADTGHVIKTLPIGGHVDAVAYDPAKKLIFTSNGEGSVSVIEQKSADEYVSAGEIQTQPSAKTMAYDPKNGRLYLSAADMAPASTPGGRPKPKADSFKVLVVGAQ